ncbi:uncharacterized protein PFLUO_LOCUS7996, partial [Penicillium psychrofluorescens]|uniref:uncharacterized protein n=1 Tax=Penicillium psychrofluorescens TaxID=3158075 RepID=UPI003CCDB0FF
MDDFNEIKNWTGNLNLTAEDSASNYEGADAISSKGTALTLQRMVDSIMADNLELNTRLSAIETKVTTMCAGLSRPQVKSRAEFPHESTIGDRYLRPAMHLDPKTTTRRDPDLFHGHNEHFFPLGRRTRDLKDQMIADQQEQRERTHEAVDDVEAYAEGQL